MLNKIFFTIDNDKFTTLKTAKGNANALNAFTEINLQAYFHRPEPFANITYKLSDEDEMNSILHNNATTKNRDNRMLSVIQTNLAHHLSYYLSELALSKYGGDLVVLNFDQHTDYSPSQNPKIGCHNWGLFSVQRQRTYISWFCKQDNYVNYIIRSPEISQNSPSSLTFDLLRRYLDGKRIYLTIDLDVLRGANRTTYPEGLVVFNELTTVILDLIDHFENNIIAVDIIGLPAIPGFATDIFKGYLNDINKLITLFNDHMH